MLGYKGKFIFKGESSDYLEDPAESWWKTLQNSALPLGSKGAGTCAPTQGHKTSERK